MKIRYLFFFILLGWTSPNQASEEFFFAESIFNGGRGFSSVHLYRIELVQNRGFRLVFTNQYLFGSTNFFRTINIDWTTANIPRLGIDSIVQMPENELNFRDPSVTHVIWERDGFPWYEDTSPGYSSDFTEYDFPEEAMPGWVNNPHFSWLYMKDYPWVYFRDLGWVYVVFAGTINVLDYEKNLYHERPYSNICGDPNDKIGPVPRFYVYEKSDTLYHPDATYYFWLPDERKWVWVRENYPYWAWDFNSRSWIPLAIE